MDTPIAIQGADWAVDIIHLWYCEGAIMPGLVTMQLSVAPTRLHAPSAAGGLWDCALLGKLARGVLAIDRLPGAAAPKRGPSCTLHAQSGLSHRMLEG